MGNRADRVRVPLHRRVRYDEDLLARLDSSVDVHEPLRSR